MTIKKFLSYALRFIIIFILFAALFMLGSGIVAGKIPAGGSEPGLVPDFAGFLLIVALETAIIGALILTSRWGGWKLAILLSLAYYGAVTILTQLEAWYFLSSLTISPDLIPALFAMRIPVCFIAIPLSVLILGRWKVPPDTEPNAALVMPVGQWAWKIALLVVAYILLYWCAGYFIAWQNPAVRSFYGSPGPAAPFLTHTLNTLSNDPLLFPFQMLRAILWVLCALPIVRGSKVNAWWTAVLVGLMFSMPQNIAHILANPLMPIASVRLSHLVETASSTFVFGMIVVWLLHRQHKSFKDLFGLEK